MSLPTPSSTAPFLDRLDSELAARERQTTPFSHLASELLYVVDVAGSRLQTGLVLQVMSRTRDKNGEWGRPQSVRMAGLSIGDAPDGDRTIVAALTGASRASSPTSWFDEGRLSSSASTFLLTDALTIDLLPAIVRTGRAFLREPTQAELLQPLQWDDGTPWTFRPEIANGGSVFVVSGHFERPGDRLELGAPALVTSTGFLIARGTVARVHPPENPSFLMTLRSAGPAEVSVDEAPRLALTLVRAGVSQVPEELRVVDVDVEPHGRLTVAATERGKVTEFDATVSFDYDGSIVGDDGAMVTFDAARRRIVRRREVRERELASRLIDAGFHAAYDFGGQPVLRLSARALVPVIEVLLAEGWRVDGQGHAYRRPTATRLTVSSRADWFDLDATVEFGETTVPITELLEALKRRTPTVRLGDGSIGILPADWLARYAPFVAAATIDRERLKFGRPQAALLDALLEQRTTDAAIAVDDEFARVRSELAAFTEIAPLPAPPGFSGTLRDYQCQGLGWFQFLRRFGFGGCLADDMGLGKTVMVLALLAWWRDARPPASDTPRPSLIVLPRSLVHNWISEAARFVPGLAVLDYSGIGRASSRARLGDYDIVLTTYGTLRRDVVDLQHTEFEYVILDEAQAIKNASTASARAARLLRGRHRLALSGTPIENHLGELWSLVEFLNPGMLGRAAVFQRATAATAPDDETMALVSRALRPFFLRRTKAQVARELPPRTEQTILCDLGKSEREVYDALRRHYRNALLARVDRVGMARSKIQVLEGLLRLRQAACHVGLVDATRRKESSAKFEVLLPQLREVVEEGHKALVFSQFTTLLGLLRNRLDADRISYEYLDGRTRDRKARIDRFQTDPNCPLFLISLKAGGIGLNLTAAEYVFLLDPWWNPAAEAQAIDRTHRIGQTKEVFAYRVIASDTVEEKVLQLQQSKRALADAVLRADAGGLRHLEREDLDVLLS